MSKTREIANLLTSGWTVALTFTKADGTERHLLSDWLGPDGYATDTHVTLMDKERNEYRTIREDSIITAVCDRGDSTRVLA